VLRNSTGHLFSAYSSVLTVQKAEIENLTVPDRLLYLFHSDVSLVSSTFRNIKLGETGSLATVLSQSTLRLTSVSLHNVTGTEHGIISLHRSSLLVASSSFTALNVSLIVAQQAYISILDSEVSDIVLGRETSALSLVPNGGLLSCLNCPTIVVAGVKCRDIHAKKGGVIYALSSEEQPGAVAVERSEFQNCSARTYGGVLSTEKCNLTISQCSFQYNTAQYGGAINFQSDFQSLLIANSSFLGNSAYSGSCIRWIGQQPAITLTTYAHNSALYGNPQASVPHHFRLLTPDLQPVTQFPVQGVTGKQMKLPLLVAVFDVFGQLIVTDNSTLVSISIPDTIKALGSTTVVSVQGLASFSFLFYPYSTATLNLTFSSPSVVNLTIPYQLIDCQPGETRSKRGCFPCPKNSYSLDPSDTVCKSCPVHAQCYGQATLSLDPHYWRSSNLTDSILPCLISESCLGGLNSTCAPGYNGTLCGACAEGYYRYATWRCKACDTAIPLPARVFLSVLLLFCTVSIPPHLFLNTEGLVYRLALVWKVLLNYTHMVMFATLLHADWDLKVLIHHEVLQVVGSVGALMVGAGCNSMKELYYQAIVASCYPAVLFLTSSLCWSFAQHKRICGATGAVVLASSFLAVYHYLPVLCLVMASLGQCQEVEGEMWLVSDMTQKCWTGIHRLFVFTLGIPLLVIVVFAHSIAILCIVKPPNAKLFQAIHLYLLAGLKDKLKFWELRLIVRRMTLCFLALAYPRLDSFSATVLCACLHGSSIQTDARLRPYKFPVVNALSLTAHLSVAAVLFTLTVKNEYFSIAVTGLGTAIVLGVSGAAVYRTRKYVLRLKENPVIGWNLTPQSSVSHIMESAGVLDPPPPSCNDLLDAS